MPEENSQPTQQTTTAQPQELQKQKSKPTATGFLATLFWVVIAWVSATVITTVIFFVPFYIPGFLKEISRLVQAGSYSYTELLSAILFVPVSAGVILALPTLVLAMLVGKYKRISSFFVFAIPILAVIFGIIVWFSSAATKTCGLYVFYFPGYNPTVCGFGDLLKAASIEFSTIFIALSVLPTALVLRRNGVVSAKALIWRGLRPGLIVLISLTVWAFVFASPYFSGQNWALSLQEGQAAKIELAKRTFIMEPGYLPTNVTKRNVEWPADEGITWKYTCENKYNAFSISQEPLSSVQKRLSQYEERDKTDPTRRRLIASGELNAWEAVTINGKKGLYQPGYLYWETENSFIRIESFGCGHSKEELIKVAESMSSI